MPQGGAARDVPPSRAGRRNTPTAPDQELGAQGPGDQLLKAPWDHLTATREERAAEFVDFATALHEGRCDYSLVQAASVNGDTKVTII